MSYLEYIILYSTGEFYAFQLITLVVFSVMDWPLAPPSQCKCFILIYVISMSQNVLCYLHSILALSYYIDVALTLSILIDDTKLYNNISMA